MLSERPTPLEMVVQPDNSQRCKLVPTFDPGRPDALPPPRVLIGELSGIIDRLSPFQQTVLKVGSVIGVSFPYSLLEAVYPIEAERPLLAAECEFLDELGILERSYDSILDSIQ